MQRVSNRSVLGRFLGCLVCLLATVEMASAQELFSQSVGKLTVKPVADKQPIQIPFITWGGDAATFHANGGLNTTGGSIYDQMGLKMKLANGDDFAGQVKKYMTGESPFLRGTFVCWGKRAK